MNNDVSFPSKPTVFLYRNRLLPASETFILEQARAMLRHRPFFIGIERVRGLDLPPGQAWVSTADQRWPAVDRLRFKLLGPSPRELETLRSHKPQLLHAHFGRDASETLSLVRQLDIPLVTTFHGYDATMTERAMLSSPAAWPYLWRRRALRRKGVLFLAVSRFIRSRLLEQGFPPDRVVVHHIGVDVDFFHPEPSLAREPAVLFVGRLTAKKGASLLIRAMQRVQSQMPDVRLIVVGDGPLRTQLEKEAQTLLTEFHFVGRQTSLQIREWMQRATVFCVPSITAADGDTEGFGIVFPHPQQSGLPVVSFASGGIPDAVLHEETGLLAPEGDWRQLSEYLLLLLVQQERWHQLSRQGLIRVHRCFNLQTQTAILEDLYVKALAAWHTTHFSN